MSFRIEDKFEIKYDSKLKLMNWLIANNFKTLFPKRKINSIYFDNDNFQSYNDSLEGCVPRKKIRVRSYSNNQNIYLEKKITAVEGRYKESKKLLDSKKILDHYFLDDIYGVCKPRIEVSYIRNYFCIGKIRITYDENIVYRSYYGKKTKSFIHSLKPIIEFKYDIYEKENKILNELPFVKIRFSKYSEGIDGLKKYGYL